MTTQADIQEAKSTLYELGERVWKGERVVIAKADKPYLDLLPHKENRTRRHAGRLAGRIIIAPDFDETPTDIMDASDGHS